MNLYDHYTLNRYINFKFKDRENSASDILLSQIVSELKKIGIQTIEAIEKVVEISFKAYLEYEEITYRKNYFHGAEVIRGIFEILSFKYYMRQLPDTPQPKDYKQQHLNKYGKILRLISEENLAGYKKQYLKWKINNY